MEVIINYSEDPPEVQPMFMGFDAVADLPPCVLYVGGTPDKSIFLPRDRPKYLFHTEEQMSHPENIPSLNADMYLPYVDRLLTILSPAASGRRGRLNVFWPTDSRYIPPPVDKIYDVVYTGGASVSQVADIITTVFPRFRYRLVAFGLHPAMQGLETDLRVSYREKLAVVARCRTAVVHNTTFQGTPQLKTRGFEAAACRSLLLVLRDSYNVIEEWFTPDKEFLYFRDAAELSRLVCDARDHYQDYLPIVQRAYDRVTQEYNPTRFVQRFLS